ncbi:MAG: 16S rRNA (cytidine(1402)-2'-O)-methyltransferase [Deltaproteobacteria bacterium]|nr:16S rRNA (cytidine(1402)-2'-O)-methyltransferase [Deltaproteobacteria bacterium]
MAGQGTLYVVATPIGNLEDITYRAVRILRETPIVAAEDTRAARVLLDRYQLSPRRLLSFFEGNEAARTEEILSYLEAGEDVALISEAGTPGVSDPGQRLIARAVENGVRIEVIPGPSAVITALVASGLDTERFLFVGFPPREEGARRELFGALRGERATLVFYEAPARVGRTLSDLALALGPSRRAYLGRELTKLHEEHVRGTLGELSAKYEHEPPRGECTLVVEGASALQAAEAEGLDVEDEVRRLLADGISPKEIAARVALATGKPRRQVYQLALVLAGKRPRDGHD